MSIKPIEFTPMPLPEDKELDAKVKIDARIKSINAAMLHGIPETSQRSETELVKLVDSKTQKNDANNTWVVKGWFSNGHTVRAESSNRWDAIKEAQRLARDYFQSLTPEIEALESNGPADITSDKASWTISTDDPRIAGLGYEIDPNSNYTVAQHASHLQKLMTGLIEKAKREGLDGRLIAMGNTDFERGFMALEKAINTNKG